MQRQPMANDGLQMSAARNHRHSDLIAERRRDLCCNGTAKRTRTENANILDGHEKTAPQSPDRGRDRPSRIQGE
jgi:hypothetical protein